MGRLGEASLLEAVIAGLSVEPVDPGESPLRIDL